jgi:hypothetical protein
MACAVYISRNRTYLIVICVVTHNKHVNASAWPWRLIMKRASWGHLVSLDRRLTSSVTGSTLQAVNTYGKNVCVCLHDMDELGWLSHCSD